MILAIFLHSTGISPEQADQAYLDGVTNGN